MLCLCLYVPLIGEAQTEFQYFESKGLPAELKSIFKLSVFITSQEFSTYRQWKQVCTGTQARHSISIDSVKAGASRGPHASSSLDFHPCQFFPSGRVAVAGYRAASRERLALM